MREDFLRLLWISKQIRSFAPKKGPKDGIGSPVRTWAIGPAKSSLSSFGLFVSTSLAVFVAPKTLYLDSTSSSTSFLHHRTFVLYWVILYELLGKPLTHFPSLKAIDDPILIRIVEFAINAVSLVILVVLLAMLYWIGSFVARASLDFSKCTRAAGYTFGFILLMQIVLSIIFKLLPVYLPVGAANYASFGALFCVFVFLVHHTFFVPVSVYCPSCSRVRILIGWLVGFAAMMSVMYGMDSLLRYFLPDQSFRIGFP